MAGHGILQYIRLKLIATLIRFLNFVGTRKTFGAPSAACTRKLARIPSREEGRTIDATIYYPDGHDDTKSSPLVVNWHGGGMMLPNLGMDHYFCEKVAREGNWVVLDADYRKSPEYPFPAPVEDVEDVLRWVEGQRDKFDLSRIAVSGFSAGGNLALVAASEIKAEFKDLKIKAAYAFYPGVDWSIPPETKVIEHPIDPLPDFAQRMFADCYVPRLEDRDNPTASPGRADPAKYLGTRIMLFPCSGDVLGPECTALGKKLAEAGVNVTVEEARDSAHGYDKTIKPKNFNEKERERTYALVLEDLSKL